MQKLLLVDELRLQMAPKEKEKAKAKARAKEEAKDEESQRENNITKQGPLLLV